MDIQSNSQESLLLLKNRISEIAPKSTAEEIMKYVNKAISENDLNPNKFAERLLSAINTAGEIRSPYYFIVKVADTLIRTKIDEIKDNKLKLAFTPLWVDMNNKKFTGEETDYVLITLIETHCYEEFPIEPQEIVDTNHAIMDYCMEHDIRTYDGFLNLLLRSKMVKKCNVPIVTLKNKAKEQVALKEKLLAELTYEPVEDPFDVDD